MEDNTVSFTRLLFRAFNYALTTAFVLVSGSVLVNGAFTMSLLLLGIPFSLSFGFFLIYTFCIHYHESNSDDFKKQLRLAQKEVLAISWIGGIILSIVFLLSALLWTPNLLLYDFISLFLFAMLFHAYGWFLLKLYKKEGDLHLPVRHKISWPIILTITLSLYYSMYFDKLHDFLFAIYFTIPVLILIILFIVSERLIILKRPKIFFRTSLFVCLLFFVFRTTVVPEQYKEPTTSIFLCFVISIYLGVFEAWKISTFEKIKSDREGQFSPQTIDAIPLFPDWKKYYTSTFIALVLAIWLIPYLYIFSKYGIIFFIGFAIHASLSFAIWFFWGVKMNVNEIWLNKLFKSDLQDFWIHLRWFMGLIFLGILLLDVRFPIEDIKFHIKGIIDTDFVKLVLAAMASPSIYKFLKELKKTYHSELQNKWWIFFDKDRVILRFASFLSFVGCIFILILQKNDIPEIVFAKSDFVYIFYLLIIIFVVCYEFLKKK